MPTDCIESTVPATSIASRFESQAQAFSALVYDKRVRPGPFKLFHYIREFGATSGKSFPGQRRMIDEMAVSGNSIKGWLCDLVEAGWLEIRCGGKTVQLDELRRKKSRKEDAANVRRYEYVLLDGVGGPWPGRNKTVRKTANGSPNQNSERSDLKRANAPFAKQRTYLMSPTGSGGEAGEDVKGGTHVEEVFRVPKFSAIPDGAFLRELKEMLDLAKEQLRKLQARDDAWVWVERERSGVAEDIAWTKEELKRPNDEEREKRLMRDLERFEAQRMERVKQAMRPEAGAAAKAWTARIEEIERAMTGAKG